MRRRAVAAFSAAAVVIGGAVVRLRVLPAARERQASRAFTALAICLAGAPRVPPEEAAVRARRLDALRPHPKNTWGGPCADEAHAITSSAGIRAVAPDLVREAEAIIAERLPDDLTALFRAGEHLRWMPAPGNTGEPVPAPLLDTELPALRRALPALAFVRRQSTLHAIDEHPLDRAVIDAYPGTIVVRAGADGRPFATAARSTERAPRRPYVDVRDGRVTLTNAAREKVDLGPGETAAAIGERVVWLHQSLLHVRSTGASAEVTFELPRDPKAVHFASCPTRAGDVLAVEMKDAVHVLLLRDGAVDRWGEVAMAHPDLPAHAGELGLTCDDAGVRLAWAVSEPPGDADIDMRGRVTLPEGPERHRVHVATCAPAGCTPRDAVVSGVDAGWQSVGGWSSPVYMQAPDAAALGARVLLVWKGSGAIRYRFAPLADLDRAPSPWIAETSRPEQGDAQDPRTVAWPRWQIHARGEAALVVVQEWTPSAKNASFLVRFDGSGDAQVLAPP